MDVEIDDHFEDFTTASEWELFIAKLEQMLTECMEKPVDPNNVTQNWLVVHEKLTFADFPFKLSYFKCLDSSDESANKISCDEQDSQLSNFLTRISSPICDFPPNYSPHIVSEYFSVTEFIVISSAGVEPVVNESRLKVLLSAACIALNNSNCNVPVFVQFHHWSQGYFSGIGEYSGIRTSFHMVMLQPSKHLPTHLTGLLEIFKSKIGGDIPNPVKIAAHFFYKIKSWHAVINCDSYPPELFDLIGCVEASEELDENMSWRRFHSHTTFLPFGSLDDPFMSLDLVAGWPSLTEDVVVDSPSYSDLEPENAQEWYFSLKSDPNAEFRLHELVDGIWKLRNVKRTVEQVLGKPIDRTPDAFNYSLALDKITRNPVVPEIPGSINRVFSKAHRRAFYNSDPTAYEDLPPLSKEQIDYLIDFLFPDAKRDTSYPYPSSYNEFPKFKKENATKLWESLQGIKSSPVGSLVWRISVLIGHLLAYTDHGSPSAVSYLWAEIILELRYRVDSSILICGLEPGSPNIGSCLLHQKLQMLNCCIEKKMNRDKIQNEKQKNLDGACDSDLEVSEDDEFFDCEDEDDGEECPKIEVSKPSGRLRKNGKLRLIKTGEPMYIPVTQDPGPLTEDMLEEQSKVMIELGDNAEASELRAKMMSASLLSDMESFKAANPGAELEDFVRWYSPRDWFETDKTDKSGNPIGELSPRMQLPGNLWMEVWSTAHSVPVRRQKRLFDDTKEAEKILHWLTTRTLSDVSELLFPCLVHAATVKVIDEIDTLNFDFNIPIGLSHSAIQLSRCFSSVALLEDNMDEALCIKSLFMKHLLQCEKDITQIRSFQLKFPSEDVKSLITSEGDCRDNINNSELFPNHIKVEGGKKSKLGIAINDMFIKDSEQNFKPLMPEQEQKVHRFGKPFKRVFVLKYNPPSTKINGGNSYLTLPQRMSCLLKNDSFVLAGTFSNKTGLT